MTQTIEDVERICCDAEQQRANETMFPAHSGGTCADCAHFVGNCDEGRVPRRYGVCTYDCMGYDYDGAMVVDDGTWHDWDECFEPAPWAACGTEGGEGDAMVGPITREYMERYPDERGE